MRGLIQLTVALLGVLGALVVLQWGPPVDPVDPFAAAEQRAHPRIQTEEPEGTAPMARAPLSAAQPAEEAPSESEPAEDGSDERLTGSQKLVVSSSLASPSIPILSAESGQRRGIERSLFKPPRA